MKKNAAVNGLRGLAIVSVVFHHSFFQYFKYGLAENHSPLMLQIMLSSGWPGVNLFFILSGYVLYLPFDRKERFINNWDDAVAFYRRRFSRLMPLYWIVSLICLIFVANYRLDDPEFYGWFAVLGGGSLSVSSKYILASSYRLGALVYWRRSMVLGALPGSRHIGPTVRMASPSQLRAGRFFFDQVDWPYPLVYGPQGASAEYDKRFRSGKTR